jgi:hypothetical protein
MCWARLPRNILGCTVNFDTKLLATLVENGKIPDSLCRSAYLRATALLPSTSWGTSLKQKHNLATS